jgi:hypothetical protein
MTDTNGFIGMAEFVQESLYILSHDILLHIVFGFHPHPHSRQVMHWSVLALYRKFKTYIPRNETARPRSQFLHSCNWEVWNCNCNWNLYFPVLWERTLGSTAGAERRAGNCRQAEVGGSSLPSP